MNTPATCPNCHRPLTQVGKHWICPEHGQVSSLGGDGDEAQSSLHPSTLCLHPLRIFLSYGHDANEELVRRIKADLEKRGHDVWFDKNDIKAGDDWRREITDGLTGSAEAAVQTPLQGLNTFVLDTRSEAKGAAVLQAAENALYPKLNAPTALAEHEHAEKSINS